jgi:hypothetical protein
MLAGGGAIAPVVLVMTLVMAVPGALGLVTPALADEHTRAAETVPAIAA